MRLAAVLATLSVLAALFWGATYGRGNTQMLFQSALPMLFQRATPDVTLIAITPTLMRARPPSLC